MRRLLPFVAVVLALLLPPAAAAQDQTITVGGPRGKLSDAHAKAIREGRMHAIARELIEATLGTSKNPSEHADWIDAPDFNCIIHVVEWAPGKQEVKLQRWFLYRPGGPANDFESLRIFGSRKVGLLYVHLGAQGADSIPTQVRTQAGLAPATPDDLRVGQVLGDGAFLASFFARVNYRVDVAKKIPAPLSNLGALIGAVQGEARELVMSTIDVWGGQIMDIRHVPSDVTVRLLTASALSPTEAAKQTYDNEGRYFWDVSVALPVTKIEQLKLDFENGVVTAKKIEKQGLIGVFNIFPRPIDTKGVRPSFVPNLMVGVGVSKKPLDTILVAAGVGVNKAQFFAGVSWVRNDEGDGVAGGEAATTANAGRVRRVYDAKFVAGLNISVMQVVEALKK